MGTASIENSDSSDREAGGLSHYEQFNRIERCTRTTAPRILGWNAANRQAIIWRPPCNQWACPACGPVNRAKASVRAFLGATAALEAGEGLFFLTLTSHENLNPWATWKVLPKAWNKLRTRASREQPGGQYFMVREHHHSGAAHIHAVTTYAMPTRWWKDNARACGFGYMADSDAVRSPPGAGAYVLKYLLKQVEGQEWQKGSRRYSASRDWPALPDLEKAEGWKFNPIPRDISNLYIMREMQESGYEVALLEKGQRLDQLETIFSAISLEALNEQANTP